MSTSLPAEAPEPGRAPDPPAPPALPVSPPAALDDSADCAEDLAGVLGTLLDDLRFAELGDVLRVVEALRGADRRRVLGLCRAGERLLALDAQGFGSVEGVPEDLAGIVEAMHFPQEPTEQPRGSLADLDGLFGLMLEALDVHWRRGDTAFVVLLLHLVAEYLPLLAWQDLLGHAGDPLLLRGQVAGTLWGTAACPQSRSLRSAAERVLDLDVRSDGGGIHPEQWEAYLERWHARVSSCLSQCGRRTRPGRPGSDALGCDRTCGVVTPYADADLESLADRLTLAASYADSPVVALRHSAPVGHYFGVPTREEVRRAWDESVERFTRRWGAQDAPARPDRPANPLEGVQLEPLEDEALPGLSAFLTAVAGHPVRPGTLLQRLAGEVGAVLAPLIGTSDDPRATPT